ncbi:hypothetical protein C8J57DRAFT_1476289, partial [Mycena rebaudengoi]
MKDSAVAAVAQGPYWILMGLIRTANALRLWAGVLSFDLEYSRLNPFSISPEDYPVGWESGQHPDDYQILSAPLKPEFFVAPRRRHDTLLWYRTSFKLGKDKFLPMSFLIWDLEPTWASSYIYLQERVYHLLKSHGRIDRHLHHMRFVNGLICYPDKITSSLQPPNMQPLNLMGEELIRRLELKQEVEAPTARLDSLCGAGPVAYIIIYLLPLPLSTYARAFQPLSRMLALCSVFRNEAHCAAARPSRSPSFIRPARTYTVKVGGELKRPNNVVDRSTTKNVTTAAQPVDLGVGRHLTAPAVSTELPCRSILTDLSAPRPDLHPSSMGVVEIAQGPYRELYHRHPFRSSSIINIDMMYAGHLKVSPEDYPVGWEEKGQHPDDYQILSAPLTQEFFVSPHRRRDDLFWF